MIGNPGDAPSGVLVIDPSGPVFGLLRALDINVPLFRITTGDRLKLDHTCLVVIAVYGQPRWESVVDMSEQASTVLIAAAADHDDAVRAAASGAMGYLDARLPPDALRRSIVGVMHGELAHSRRVLADLIRGGRWLRAASTLPLTPRQRQVIALIANGAADKEIACSLGISTATAQKHVTNVLKRLNVPNRAAAVAAMSARNPWYRSTQNIA